MIDSLTDVQWDRFWARIYFTPGCWWWTGNTRSSRYGQMGIGKLPDGTRAYVLAHRIMFTLVHGPIPDGLTIDHLCRNTFCVNPDHLEAVSMRENILRGTSFSAINATKTHCPKGHAYDLANTRLYKKPRKQYPQRLCRACDRLRGSSTKRREYALLRREWAGKKGAK